MPPGLYALWKGFHDVRTEIADAGEIRFEHQALAVILAGRGGAQAELLEQVSVDAGHAALPPLFVIP